MPTSLYTVLIFVKMSTRRFFRDRVAIFFTIAFPLIFLFIFGGLFGRDSSVSFKVGLVNESSSSFSKQYVEGLQKGKVFKIDSNVSSLSGAQEKMNRGEIDATIVLPKDFGEQGSKGYPTGNAKVYYTQNSEESAKTLITVLEGQFKGINTSVVKADIPFTVSSEQTNQKGLSSFDYRFAGLLGFAIIGLGIFGPVNVFPELKKQGILRRYHTTPLKVWQFFVSNALSQAVIGLLTMAIMFAVSIVVFDLKVIGNVFELALFLVFGIIMILGIGLAIGGWAANERQAAPISNLVVFPMMFLSGTFFPRFLMPEWLQNASGYLPLTPVIDGIRLIATEGKSLIDIAPQVGLIGAWMFVVYVIAFRVFRWE